MDIILIGRGASCLRCNREFVESHDLVAVVNKFIYAGYEKYVGTHADVQFITGGTSPFAKDQVIELGLKRVVYTNKNKNRVVLPQYYYELGVEVVKSSPPIKDIMDSGPLDPSSGVVGMYYLLNNYNVRTLSLVGFDLYEVGQTPYYFKKEEADRKLRYLWRGAYRGNKINQPSGHNARLTALYMGKMFKEFAGVTFNIITNSTRLEAVNLKNIKFKS